MGFRLKTVDTENLQSVELVIRRKIFKSEMFSSSCLDGITQQNQTFDSTNRIKLDPQSSERCFSVFLAQEIKISGTKVFHVRNLNK